MNRFMSRVSQRVSQGFSRSFSRGLMGVAAVGLSVSALSACGHSGPMPFSSFNTSGAPMSEADATQWRERMVERVSSQLKLDAAQKQNLVALAKTLQEQRQQFMGAATTAAGASAPAAGPRAELQALIAGPRFDAQAAQALANRKADAMRTASPKLIAAFGTFYDSLKPEQQQQVRDFMNRPHGNHWSHHGHGDGHEGGHGSMMN